jgi:NAD(P)-dependent dehydrogenase (short-subunit alcohol dehydrogenase family)
MGPAQLRTYRDGVAIMTGGASGIGRALAEELGREGAEVVLADLQVEMAEEVAAGIRKEGGRAKAVFLDVTDFEAVNRVIQETVASSGRLDYLFNNAGIVILGEAHFHGIDDWNKVIDVNLRGVVHGVQAAYPLMRRQGFGHIVNTASIAGLLPVAGEPSYVATKHAVVGLSSALRIEAALAGVRVSVLCPGAVETPIASGGKFGKMLQPIPEETRKRLWAELGPIQPAAFAKHALAAIAKNQDIIVLPWRARLLWWLYRICPGIVDFIFRRMFLKYKDEIEQYSASPGRQ